jgi:hypothetical protein
VPIYTIVWRSDRSGYDVSIKDESGARHTVLGFKTEDEAKAWIRDAERHAAEPEQKKQLPGDSEA